MLVKTIIAGFGGQGVLSMGVNLAEAAMQEGKNVTYLPAYGAEVRGGTANCTVAISDDEIASPVASSPDFVIALNQPSALRFQNQIQSGGLFFVNSSLVETELSRGDITVLKVPASNIAEELGSSRSANMVMLGAFIKKSGVVSLESVIEALAQTLGGKKKLLDINERALRAGYELA
ncbi:MAG: 2-oxoacid:ferredoxin oxidoreductase subunit gamma [Chloroflexi bacterium]|nr:2-oxoacid:ferredoxin oxidoreductase subunit gamma [Chloroflexota bacterium]MBM3173255.1 2-oxoacid:ferredoxin oxidoreductase subunit gamma [Chloroflexota bacterium]MBM3174874.1 2-oxoacid:ferredoxin oxidoreductase subunit gamma [Chloroflexota bacterium]MBM4450043.1 2-oxoacid:ferredoxin oxidoreductase subunit gamma [Chloroflexota bacterium]